VAKETEQQGQRIVVKIGTGTICDASGSPDIAFLADLAQQIARLRDSSSECVIVSSGAIRAGLDLLALPHMPRSMPIKQAAAAVGQGRLMELYAAAFKPFGLTVAQILLTRDDFHDRKRYIHAGNTLSALLKLGVVPIVNENDTIAVEEIKVGDNDTLAALVAGLIAADLLVLLSHDIDGLHTADPKVDADAPLIAVVTNVDEIQSAIGATSSSWGTGGMRTKIEAASLCMQSGIPMTIANGRHPGVLDAVIARRAGTRFEPSAFGAISARKRWIAGGQRPAGLLRIHEAACEQLIHSGRSLLPAGITSVEGEFRAGELVVLEDKDGAAIGRGIVNYDHETIRRIMGMRTSDIRKLNGESVADEVIHRDNLVVINRGE
jgi:glutamate 5-kinase